MKIEYVSHWDKLYLTPAVSVVLDPMFVFDVTTMT